MAVNFMDKTYIPELVWLIHHKVLLEISEEHLDNRRRYIRTSKPKAERPRRLRWMRVVKHLDRFPPKFQKLWADYIEAFKAEESVAVVRRAKNQMVMDLRNEVRDLRTQIEQTAASAALAGTEKIRLEHIFGFHGKCQAFLAKSIEHENLKKEVEAETKTKNYGPGSAYDLRGKLNRAITNLPKPLLVKLHKRECPGCPFDYKNWDLFGLQKKKR